jgi:rubrerythrin
MAKRRDAKELLKKIEVYEKMVRGLKKEVDHYKGQLEICMKNQNQKPFKTTIYRCKDCNMMGRFTEQEGKTIEKVNCPRCRGNMWIKVD